MKETYSVLHKGTPILVLCNRVVGTCQASYCYCWGELQHSYNLLSNDLWSKTQESEMLLGVTVAFHSIYERVQRCDGAAGRMDVLRVTERYRSVRKRLIMLISGTQPNVGRVSWWADRQTHTYMRAGVAQSV
jgi:deoxyribodipyrimidine photolyase-like uncharacterized protein